MPKLVRENGLSIVLFSLFAVFLAGQSLTGWRTFNSDQREHDEQTISFALPVNAGA